LDAKECVKNLPPSSYLKYCSKECELAAKKIKRREEQKKAFETGIYPGKNQYLKFHPDREQISLHEILNMTPELFEARFANSVIKRCGLERLKRNARICLANISAPAT